MKNELTSAQTMVELAKQGEEFKPLECDHSILGTFNTTETALEKGQRIHDEVNKQLEFYASGQFDTNDTVDPASRGIADEIFQVTGGKFITDCSLLLQGFYPITKSPSVYCQQWGRMFRGRLPEEISPKPQPNYFELNELYGYVSSRQYSVFEPVSLAMNLWFYSNYGLEC